MLPDSTAVDPYRSPALPETMPPGSSRGRPTGLTVLCVLCMVLGALGLMNSLLGTVGAVAGPYLQRMFQPKGPLNEMQKIQQRFQDEANDVQNKYYTPSTLALVFRFIAALLLLIGGVRTLSLCDRGRKMLLAACAIALIFELGHSVLYSIINIEMRTAFNSLVEGMVSPGDGKMPPGAAKFAAATMRIMYIAQFVLMLALVLAKGGLYIFGYVYLQKQQIKALFHPV